ncbi:MAG: AAA family ATPase [Candidatus Thiodiazotropha sp.]
MYESYYGFRDTPFRLSADEKFRYAHKNYLRASAYLAYALQQGEGFVMITGQPGSGKTTLVRDVISEIDAEKFQALNLVTSQLHAEELLRKVALEYGLPAETYNKATLLTSIHKHLSNLHEQGKRSILFLNEAQNLSLNGLEELRLLSNLQQGSHSLLQIVLIGHDELRELLLGPGMEHIQQRLIAICQIQPMTEEQTREYVIHRLGIVGWRDNPQIQDDVYHLIHQASQGVARNINHLMSRLLLFGSLEEKQELTDEDALTIIEELVDEQRISLAGQVTVQQFAAQYRSLKQHQGMQQAVGDHPISEPHRQPTQNVASQPDPAL